MIFKLFENCKVTKGATESAIFDLLEGNYISIPNQYLVLLNNFELEKLTVQEQDPGAKEELLLLINAFYEKLIDLRLGHFVENPALFPPVNPDYKWVGQISNAILEISHDIKYDLQKLLSELAHLGCKAIEFRFLDCWEMEDLEKIFCHLHTSKFVYFNLIFYKTDTICSEQIQTLTSKYPRINRVKQIQKKNTQPSPESCKVVKNNPPLGKLNINLKVFLESLHRNVAFSGKLVLDQFGNLKNYTTHKTTFGNIADNEIAELITNSAFQYLWNVKIDEVEKCKDCQFRYVCVDFSPLNHEGGKIIKQIDCGFSPYQPIEK